MQNSVAHDKKSFSLVDRLEKVSAHRRGDLERAVH
jgi:hypothetical protein